MSRFWMLVSCLGFCLLPLGCQSVPGEGKLVFEGSLNEGKLVFRNVPAGKTQERDVWLTNTGTAPVEVTSLAFVGDSEDFALVKKIVTPFTLQPGYPFRLPLRIRYESDDIEPKEVALRVVTDNSKQKELELPVLFENKEVKLSWDCNNEIVFDQTPPGGVSTKTCVLKNAGKTGNLTVMGVEYRAEKGERDAFQWRTPVMPLFVGTGEQSSITVTIAYKPSVGGNKWHEGKFVLIGVDGPPLSLPPLKVKGEVGTRSLKISLLPFFYCTSNEDCQQFGSELTCQQQGSSKRCIAISPSNLTMKFPYVFAGQSTRREIRLTSDGSGDVEVKSLTLGGELSGFSIVDGKVPFTIKASTEKLITIEYKPTDSSSGQATLQLDSNAPNAKEVTIQLGALKEGCFLDVTPKSRRLEFDKAGTKTLSISNHGNVDCNISSAVMASKLDKPFRVVGLSFPLRLKPRESRSLSIRFLPESSATARDTLYFLSNDQSKPILAVALEGKTTTTKGCQLVPTPSRMNFQETLFDTPRVQTLALNNNGTERCVVTRYNLKLGGLSLFAVTTSQKTPMVIEPGKSLPLTVTYLPVLEGEARDEIQVTYEGNNTTSRIIVPVVGKGKEPCLVVSPKSVVFSQTKQSCVSSEKKITVWHTGGSHCPSSIRVTSVTLSNNKNFNLTGLSLKDPIVYGSVFSFRVTMTPQTQGTLRSIVLIKTDSALQPLLQVPLEGKTTGTSQQTDIFSIPVSQKVDLLFVIDDSASMGQAQLAMAGQAKVFLDKATLHKADFHIGVTTTDTTDSRFPAGCLQGKTKIVYTQTPNAADALAQNFKVGTAGSASEKGLDAALAAFSASRLRDTSCNVGFLRKDARLAIIVVSDENDASTGDVDFFVRRLWGVKQPEPQGKMLFSTITGPPLVGCRANGISAAYGVRYWDVSKKMGGVQLSFCDSQWKSNAELLGDLNFGPQRRFFLSRPRTIRPLKVTVDGTTLKPILQYDHDVPSNSVSIKDLSVLKPGSRVEISYEVKCR